MHTICETVNGFIVGTITFDSILEVQEYMRTRGKRFVWCFWMTPDCV